MKDKKKRENKMSPDEANTAHLPNINIIFYPVRRKMLAKHEEKNSLDY